MENQLNAYIDQIKNDYLAWWDGREVNQEMVDRFNNSIQIVEGSKFFKIISNGGVHSFIVKEDTPKFSRGTILKAASWSSPAKNFGRGNILTSGYKVSWTGAI